MRSIGAIVLVLSFGSIPVIAHHSFAAEYDSKKPVELKGALISLEWVNPHAWIHMEVKDETGKATKWDCELAARIFYCATAGVRIQSSQAIP